MTKTKITLITQGFKGLESSNTNWKKTNKNSFKTSAMGFHSKTYCKFSLMFVKKKKKIEKYKKRSVKIPFHSSLHERSLMRNISQISV